MPPQTYRTAARTPALAELRLDGWVPRRQDSRLLGSLTDVLSDFASGRRPAVPAQRISPTRATDPRAFR